MMTSIAISEFRANMRVILRKVEAGEIISLTQRGNEVARLVPPDFAQSIARERLNTLRETAVIGDVLSPVDDTWDTVEA